MQTLQVKFTDTTTFDDIIRILEEDALTKPASLSDDRTCNSLSSVKQIYQEGEVHV